MFKYSRTFASIATTEAKVRVELSRIQPMFICYRVVKILLTDLALTTDQRIVMLIEMKTEAH
ncbi:hypothetical protein M595_4281 [Lyngbya aestuarii BL J]|uniref:Uncharacterized protein n=1 Tax=Lyngbya aestuarii BL J TaxID=1348334 RepID=U7QFD2_9CYAN|nr:hypothetical protein [Lyngbya aestuarii]ERT05795.1 hypothetical protein M595_4281 [Lyngbya aestuarii BL J]